MNGFALQVCTLASRQHEAVATWQLRRLGWTRGEIYAGVKGLRRVHRGVWATGDLSELGWYMAAALAMGPTGAISHLSALILRGLRPHKPIEIHVSHRGGGRGRRPGLQIHRRGDMETETWRGIPVTTPSQSLRDADLPPHELYRALEAAEKRHLHLDLPLNDVVQLKRTVSGYTRSDTEARFLILLSENRLPLPLVNHILNGYEADFHWPELRLVVEVDGWEHHRERDQFNEDRYRGLAHEAVGDHLVRVSADHVHDHPRLVLAALRECGVRAAAGRPAPAFA